MTDERHQHTHLWQTHSTHRTLDGLVSYQFCKTCGEWRIEAATDNAEEIARIPLNH